MPPPSKEEEASSVRFMTFNIRFDTMLDEPRGNRWSDRVDSVIETVRTYKPDVVGFQEALRSQLADLTASFPEYKGFGKPREVGETAEYVPVFVLAERFEVEESGDFWLSPTPRVEGSRGWDTDVPRHCTWARLGDRTTGTRFAVFNTHLDVKGTVARFEAAKVILAEVRVAPDLPSVVMGDFNAPEDSEPMEVFRTAGFRDSFRAMHPDATDVQTIHHYVDLSGRRKIDFILCDRRWKVLAAEIIRRPATGRLPSDHYPVVAELVPERKSDDK
ncbi:MAG TPA: endonuclease/exonuclease/phosphatase family protein [Actinomycetota bacterium]|nr:endonuclease/exonuclease/phosphatase family protein [Actinomycetota bacterium]